jgi:DNA-directed RNA polymerase subunit H (RpoH/RPB5)
MIIIDDEPNDTIQTRLKYIWEHDKQHVVVHNINRLQYNLMNHVLVPKCNILTDEETTLFKQKYSVQTNKQLPEISRFDPQSLVMCMRPGDIVRFERKSQSALHYDYYRLCVN